MALLKLDLETAAQVRGGAINLMFLKALQRAQEDIETAPDIDKARTVQLTLKLTPVLDQGRLDDIEVEFVVTGKAPARSTCVRMAPRIDENRQRRLLFPEQGDDVNQLEFGAEE